MLTIVCSLFSFCCFRITVICVFFSSFFSEVCFNMDVKKHVLPEQVPSPTTSRGGGNVFSGLGWALVASLIVLTGLSLNNSLKPPPVVGSLSYSVSNATANSPSSSSLSNATEELHKKIVADDGVDIDIEGTHLENSDEGNKTVNFGSVFPESSDLQGSNGDGVILEKSNFSVTVNNGTLVGENVGNFAGEEKATALLNDDQGNLAEENKTINSHGDDDQPQAVETCDFFDGRWVKNNHSKPYYTPGSCPHIDKDFDCQRNGRPDNGYIEWKWQPYGCDIPR